jgi:plastocyanin
MIVTIRRRLLGVVLLAAAACAGLAGCGGSAPGKPTVTVATPTIRNGVQVFDVRGTATQTFAPSELDAAPGLIRVNFSVDQQSPPHDFIVASIPDAKTPVVSAGASTSLSFRASKPGSYQFVCSIHTNMQGILKVR